MSAIVGATIGLFIYHFIIKPYERKKIRRELEKDGIIPKEFKGGGKNDSSR